MTPAPLGVRVCASMETQAFDPSAGLPTSAWNGLSAVIYGIFHQIDKRFEWVDKRIGDLRDAMDARFKSLEAQIDEPFKSLDKRIGDSQAQTNSRFDRRERLLEAAPRQEAGAELQAAIAAALSGCPPATAPASRR
ncbi:hypothetical protein [Methylacidimicrobium sp. B4]|uniref:hypothetical protein n=1 Tax=Methylacidimicrobium sp. B4 TaxID=2796139 RepID=UPI001A8D2E52|nr:hypothetical protein [Methylacidimicrobium sp. B4]QSR84684.1 hypothetical protein MacB4_10920 [Methylacidimicrobium sp. B4]